ncbi:MAG: msrA [Betaproteobacteria bacterium]|nr:msrA [Betaproteobacteria bacterium]
MQSNNDPSTREVATLAGGCFWCLEAVYDELKGVESVESGYMGGAVVNPTYEQVCGGDTGHAEVVQIKFNPAVVTFGDILGIFFAIHDPTTLNRQGNDLGTQYRSAIFYHTPKQKEVAQEVMGDIAREQLYPRPLVTQLEPASTFYVAEDYHREYFARNPNQGYCQFVVAPKVAKFRKSFFDRLKKTEKTKA